MSMPAPRGHPWYRQPYVWLLVAVPASSVIVGVAMIIISVRSFDGLVVDDYYRRGLEINRDLRRVDAAIRRGLRAELTVNLDERTLGARVTSAISETALLPGKLTLLLVHPTRAGLDRSVTLEQTAPGVYRGRLAPLAPGRWHVRLETQDWRLAGRMPVPGTGLVDLSPGE